METLSRNTILLVEDQAIIAMTERVQLEKAGYHVVHVTTGERAIETATNKSDSIDLILMDIDLGDGIDGTEAAERILAKVDVPIVFLSSHTEREYVDKTDGISSYGYVVKNSGEMVLLRSITMAFRLHAANRRLEQRNAEVAAAEHRYHQLFENMTAGFALHEMLYDADGRAVDYRFLDVNPAFERLTGLTAKHVVGRTVRELLPDTEQYWIDAYASVLETGDPIEFENFSQEFNRYFEVWAYRHDPGTFAVVTTDTTERKLREQELHEHREYLATTLDSIGDAVVATDHNARVVRMNPVAEQLTGWTHQEAEGRPLEEIFNIIHAETRHPAASPVSEALRTGTTVGLANHTALLSRDGHEYHIADSAAPIRDRSESVQGAVMVFRDVSEDYRLRQELKARERFLEKVFESVQEGIGVLDVDFTIRKTNDTVQQWFPDRQNLVGEKCYEVYRGLHAPCDECPVSRAIATGRPESSTICGYAGAPGKWIEAFAYPMKNSDTGEVTGVVEFMRDISERKAYEERLNHSRWLLQNVIDSSVDYIYVKDRELRTIVCNNVFAAAVGRQPEELIGRTDLENGWAEPFVKGDPERGIRGFETDDLAALSGATVHVVDEPGNVAEDVRLFDTMKSPFRDPSGEIIGVLGISRDITEQVRLQREVEKAHQELQRI